MANPGLLPLALDYEDYLERLFSASGSLRSEQLPGFELSLERLFGDPTQTRPA